MPQYVATWMKDSHIFHTTSGSNASQLEITELGILLTWQPKLAMIGVRVSNTGTAGQEAPVVGQTDEKRPGEVDEVLCAVGRGFMLAQVLACIAEWSILVATNGEGMVVGQSAVAAPESSQGRTCRGRRFIARAKASTWTTSRARVSWQARSGEVCAPGQVAGGT
jgi:hypothetical protein